MFLGVYTSALVLVAKVSCVHHRYPRLGRGWGDEQEQSLAVFLPGKNKITPALSSHHTWTCKITTHNNGAEVQCTPPLRRRPDTQHNGLTQHSGLIKSTTALRYLWLCAADRVREGTKGRLCSTIRQSQSRESKITASSNYRHRVVAKISE